MGRGKQSDAPALPTFMPSEIRYGNNVVGKTYIDPSTGAIISQYIPDPVEEQRKTLLQQKINEILPTLGRTAPELAQQYNDTEQNFIEEANKKFLQYYNPTVRDLREDVASRFGSLNTSTFLDSLNDLEKNKASAFADIINRGKTLKYGLVEQDESRKLRELQNLYGILGSDASSSTNGMQSSLNPSGVLNDFLNSQYITQLNQYRQSLASKNQNSNSKPWYMYGWGDLV